MIFRSILAVALLLLSVTASFSLAAPIYYVGSTFQGNLDSVRNSFLSVPTYDVTHEGFEDTFPGDDPNKTFPIGGPSLLRITENSQSKHVVSVDKNSAPQYVYEGNHAVRVSINNPSEYIFDFLAEPINKFGVVITDVDFDTGDLSFSDDQGNSNVDFGPQLSSDETGAVFFGVISDIEFNSVTLTASGNPAKSWGGFIGFDTTDYGPIDLLGHNSPTPPTATTPVHTPEPAAIVIWGLVGMIALGIVAWRRRARTC